MTTEIAILNQQAVALAADSAVTASAKIFQSANKIFSLSKVHPVGVMIYASAEFMDVPWETIIKVYRERLGARSFPYLHDYATDFIKFLQTHIPLAKSYISDKEYVKRVVEGRIISILRQCEQEVVDITLKSGPISDIQAVQIINKKIEDLYSFLEKPKGNLSLRELITREDFISSNKDQLEHIYSKYLEVIPGLNKSKDDFFDAAFNMCTKEHGMLKYSGVVVAGFGEDEICPRVETHRIGGIVCNEIQSNYVEAESATIGNDFYSAKIIGFAQSDIIDLFMTGRHPKFIGTSIGAYEAAIDMVVDRMFDIFDIDEKIKKMKSADVTSLRVQAKRNLRLEIDGYVRSEFIGPTMDVVSSLPPLEVAEMAEAMVNLTSLERKISHQRESVGGPTDVALISKGDGFVWVKRKHYFTPELNHHFFKNYFRSCYGQDKEAFNQKIDD